MTPSESIAKRRASMPPAYRKGYDEAMTGDSYKACVAAKCYECMGWEESPANCTCPACPSFPKRPSGRPITGTSLTPEQREASVTRLALARKSRADGLETEGKP